MRIERVERSIENFDLGLFDLEISDAEEEEGEATENTTSSLQGTLAEMTKDLTPRQISNFAGLLSEMNGESGSKEVARLTEAINDTENGRMEDPDEVWGLRPRRQSPCDKVVEGFGEVKSNLNDLTNGLNLSGNYWICEILNNNLILNFNEIMTSKIVYIGCLNGEKKILFLLQIKVSRLVTKHWSCGMWGYVS